MGLRNKLLQGAVVLALLAGVVPAVASDSPQMLKWADLIPKTAPAQPSKAKTFFGGSTPVHGDDAAPPPLAEGNFMSVKRRQPGSDRPPEVVADLDGKSVSIGGYVVPLDFDATTVKEFLLVPFVGACIHVPPPPANQIIYVKSDKGFEVGGMFDPVTVTGKLTTAVASTGLADAGYTIAADSVQPRTK
ncbi:DUF3299 domain-containing protein [Hyphomicrobium methylovorum]|uniref:DUF3299 domain-containing protein n=1 Tax=Hyphomicrobium methylovorum TaxID=84 RepID=UPI0015E737A7|nr:DUF3299 domain-containing protein [Hyphomicrobium methylovorum]MBA2126769.1 DUF3299 domain-containing protein [Hyphomicrobium methylovorum]